MKKQHYFLVAGQVVFHTEDGNPGQVLLNALVTNDSKTFPVRMIGKAQQALQLHFFKKVGDGKATVLDVPILNVSYLGLMTEKEFHATPEGTKLQERAPDDPFADKGKPPVVADAGSEQVN